MDLLGPVLQCQELERGRRNAVGYGSGLGIRIRVAVRVGVTVTVTVTVRVRVRIRVRVSHLYLPDMLPLKPRELMYPPFSQYVH